jgi:tetratricopeptide (TPR) repeat protein
MRGGVSKGMRKPAYVIWILAIMSILAPASHAADLQNQNWLLFEQGNAAFSAREYGHALQLYKDAIAGAGNFPEAEMAIADVYVEEGEPDLAIKQYQKAYGMRNYFYIPDSQYEVLYKLSRLYISQQSYGLMEQTLLTITAEDKHFIETDKFILRSQVQQNYLAKGLDRVLMLYVFDDQFAASAHSMLGWYAYRSGRYTQAIQELLFSLISRTSEIVAFLHERDADYNFTTLDDLLALATKSKDAVAFLKEVDFFKDLYYLACATHTSGYPQSAIVLWKKVAASTIAGDYQELAKRQLKSPSTEPLLLTPKAR